MESLSDVHGSFKYVIVTFSPPFHIHIVLRSMKHIVVLGSCRAEGPTSFCCKTPMSNFNPPGPSTIGLYLIKSTLSGSWPMETGLWGLWTSKTNGDPSM